MVSDCVFPKILAGCFWLALHVAKSFTPTLNSVASDKVLHLEDCSQLFSNCPIKSLATLVGFFSLSSFHRHTTKYSVVLPFIPLQTKSCWKAPWILYQVICILFLSGFHGRQEFTGASLVIHKICQNNKALYLYFL